jgi:hypothetical protein
MISVLSSRSESGNDKDLKCGFLECCKYLTFERYGMSSRGKSLSGVVRRVAEIWRAANLKRAMEFLGKRHMEFLGKRNAGSSDKRTMEFLGKRAMEFLGKRGMEFLGKRIPLYRRRHNRRAFNTK